MTIEMDGKMSCRKMDSDMPGHIDRVLFLTGLTVFVIGQVVINSLHDALHTQTPIDYAHWLLIIAVVLMTPFAVNLRRSYLSRIAGVLLLVGIVSVIGMCILDFVFWTLGPSDQANELYLHLKDVPAIWQVFMVYGPGWIFNTAIALASLEYLRTSKTGTFLVLVGSLVILIGTQWFNVLGYVIIVVGYFLNFNRLRRGD